jgi:hypothetical protein
MRVAVGSLVSSLIIFFSPNPSIIFACNLQYEKFVCSWWKCFQMPTTRISIGISNLLNRQLRVVSHVSSHHLSCQLSSTQGEQKKGRHDSENNCHHRPQFRPCGFRVLCWRRRRRRGRKGGRDMERPHDTITHGFQRRRPTDESSATRPRGFEAFKSCRRQRVQRSSNQKNRKKEMHTGCAESKAKPTRYGMMAFAAVPERPGPLRTRMCRRVLSSPPRRDAS